MQYLEKQNVIGFSVLYFVINTLIMTNESHIRISPVTLNTLNQALVNLDYCSLSSLIFENKNFVFTKLFSSLGLTLLVTLVSQLTLLLPPLKFRHHFDIAFILYF